MIAHLSKYDPRLKIIANIDDIMQASGKDLGRRFDYWLNKALTSENTGHYGIDALTEHFLAKPKKFDELVKVNPHLAKFMLGKVLAIFATNMGYTNYNEYNKHNTWYFEKDKVDSLRQLSKIAVKHLDVFAAFPNDSSNAEGEVLFDALLKGIHHEDHTKFMHTANAFLAAVKQRSENNALLRLRTLFYHAGHLRPNIYINDEALKKAEQVEIYELKDAIVSHVGVLTGQSADNLNSELYTLLATTELSTYQLTEPTDYKEHKYRDYARITRTFVSKIASMILKKKELEMRDMVSFAFPITNTSSINGPYLHILSAQAYNEALCDDNVYMLSSRFNGSLAEFKGQISKTPASRLRKWHSEVIDACDAFIATKNNIPDNVLQYDKDVRNMKEEAVAKAISDTFSEYRGKPVIVLEYN